MTFVENIEKLEYNDFVRNAKKTHFMQSYEFGEIRKLKNTIPHYVGLKENNQLVATALLLEKKLPLGYKYYYVPRGYVIDYKNLDLLKEFTLHIKRFAKKNKAIFVKIDPDIKRHTISPDGIVTLGENNYDLIKYLKKLGYKHLGYNKGFEREQPRFTFRLDIDKPFDEVYKNFHATTRKILNKGNKYNLKIYKGDESDIKDFYITMEETAKREGIHQAKIEYYLEFFKKFNEENLSDIYVSKVDIEALKKLYQTNINSLEEEIESLTNPKHAGKVNDIKIQLDKMKKELEEISLINEKEVVLSSIITVKYKDMVWTVHGGNNSILMNLNANYLVYYNIIKDASIDGFKCVDFFGTTGIPNPDRSNPIYGIHNFKKRLGGEYIEFIGEFDLVTNKFMYLIFKTFIPMYRKIKRNLSK